MVTNDERREVARKLRAAKRPSLMVLLDVLGVGGDGAFARLADLIEPSETKVKCVAEVKVDGEQLEKLVHEAVVEYTGVDRDALLALADELDSSASMLMKQNDLDPNRKRRGMRRDHAQSLMAASDRIRAACGEVKPCDERS